MVFIDIYKHICRCKVTHLIRRLKNKESQFHHSQWQQKKFLLSAPTDIHYSFERFLSSRFNSDICPDFPQVQLPPLTDEKPIILQSVLSFLLINPYYFSILSTYYDREFDVEEFSEGSEQALEVVSQAIATEDFDNLEGLVTNNVITKVRQSMTKLSEAQKQLIPILKENIVNNFPFRVRINRLNIQEKKCVSAEITMLCYSYRREQAKAKKIKEMKLKNFNDMIISNYHLRREYNSDSISSPWIITMYNQFTIMGLQSQSS